MNQPSGFSRRDAFKLGAAGSAALVLPFGRTALAKRASDKDAKLPNPYTVPFAVPPVLVPTKTDDVPCDPDFEHKYTGTDYYVLRQMAAQVEILPGLRTTIYGYNGITPGPTIKARRGRQIVVYNQNALPAKSTIGNYVPWTSTHLHGSSSLPQYDGYASDVTQPGQWKRYVYPNCQDARTLWYHDHGVHHTAENAYMGLAGMYLMSDEVEDRLPIPKNEYDVPLVLKDISVGKSGNLTYDNKSESSYMGDIILVNGKPWPIMDVEPRKYRFRLLNACISRSFLLSLSTREGFQVIATDGGLMPKPQTTASLRLGMAERYEIVIDFAKYKGKSVDLVNGKLPNNVDYDHTDKVMRFRVGQIVRNPANNEVPADLNPNQDVMGLQASQAVKTRDMVFERTGSNWVVNGTTWQNVVDSNYQFSLADPVRDSVEIWNLQNKSGGWFHPVHIHLIDFKILDRNGKAPFNYEQGPKDVAYVGENETVRVIMRFNNQNGRYMIHCHNLVHEDHDMMGQFNVVGSKAGDDPIFADPARAGDVPPF